MISDSPLSDWVLQGQYYPGNGSPRQQALLRFAGAELVLEYGETVVALPATAVRIAPQVGSSPRCLYLPDDAMFETPDNKGVDQLAAQLRQGFGSRLIHRLESHLLLIMVAVVVTVSATLFTFIYGVPLMARTVAHLMPEHVSEHMGESALSILDQYVLSPSRLPDDEQARLHQIFAPYLESEEGISGKLLFRRSAFVGANAMALPDGTIIMTDDLVNLAEHDEELVAILAHEMGHVVHRHGMQGVVQSSLATGLLVLMTGDVSAFADGAVIGPVVLVNLAYSRNMEREADDYALAVMQQHGIDPIHFANIMRKLVASHGGESLMEDHKESDDKSWRELLGGFISTHPHSRDRIRQFEEASAAE